MLLKVNNVSKQYSNGIKALSDVSFEADRGEFISVVGPSGSGKSTLLRTLNRLVDVTDGSILFENIQIEKLKGNEIKKLRRKIGMIFQNYNLVERLTVIENVLHGRLGYKSVMTGILGIILKERKKRLLNYWIK